jgi:hypothetical protein
MLEPLKSSILTNLRNPDFAFWSNLEQEIEKMLVTFVESKDEENANRAWYLKAVSTAYKSYCTCFSLMQKGLFYDAWCLFERIEIELMDLQRNPIYAGTDFHLDFLTERVSAFQALFPYKIFFSPEMIVRHRECGICGALRSPWEDCGHEVGKVYMGKICSCIAKDVELLSVSLVTNPVQKYSVGFSCDENGEQVDHYDYSIVAFLVSRIASPFDGWSYELTQAYHPHAMFSDVSDDALCPCESGRTYSSCCRTKPGVLRPHCQFYFEVPPPDHLPQFELPKRKA